MRRFLVAVAWLSGAGVAFAQEQPKASISASLIDAWLIRGEVCCQSNPSLPTTGIGGSAVGIVLGLDVALSRTIGIDAEFSAPAFATDHQEAFKYKDNVRHRDMLLSGYARFFLRRGSMLRIEPVAGGSLVFSNVQTSTSYLVDLVYTPPQISATYGPYGEYVRFDEGQELFALSGGLDVAIGRGRFAIVPTFRLHYIFREEVLKDQVGLGHWAIRPGVGVRIAF
jgi:hypothetical protein